MKISQNTLTILKNFNTINQSLVVRPGNVLKTMAYPGKNVFARAEVEESFPSKFAIYELSKFLGAISLFTSPDFEFFDDHMKISEGKNFIRYVYANEDLIGQAPDKEIVLPSEDIYFELSEADLAKTLKALGVLGVPELSVVGEDGTIYLKAASVKDPTSDSFSIAVGSTAASFSMVFKGENMKLMSSDYKVKISAKGIAQFAGSSITYWIATEQSSKYGV